MKFKKAQRLTIAVTFVVGAMSGAFLEKAYGIKNLLKAIGVASQINRQETTAQRKDSIPDVYQGKLQLFILAGQSNMSGMGDVPLTNVATNTRIYVFGNDYRWKLAEEPVDDPRNQVDLVSEDKPAGFGPSVSFATTLLKQRPNIAIGLIPCAKGGSLIHEWQRNLNDTALYGSCLKRVRAASVMGTVAGLLFFQGEIDAIDPMEHPNRTFLPHRWANEFTELISDWRSDLSLPELPVVFAQIGTNTRPDRFKHWEVVKEQQRQVQLPFTVMMTTDDLPLKDYVHFTTESYQIIGQRFANAYLTLPAQMNQKSQNKE